MGNYNVIQTGGQVRTAIALTSTVSNWTASSQSVLAGQILMRDGGLHIEGHGPYFVRGLGQIFDPASGDYSGVSNFTETRLLGAVRNCCNAWRSAVVDYALIEDDANGVEFRSLPFQTSYEARALDSASFNLIMGRLAVAGSRLFKEIFNSGDEALSTIGSILERAGRQKNLVLTMTSDQFFVPWRMLYVHPTGELAPNGSNWQKEGFWAYKHIVEHNTKRMTVAKAIDSRGRVINASFCANESIAADLGYSAKDHIDSLLDLPLKLKMNQTKAELAGSFQLHSNLQHSGLAHLDQLLYFCCYGYGGDTENGGPPAPAKMLLSDGQAITSNDFAYWQDTKPFENSPLVLINTCQGGQVGSLFYRDFVRELLARKAGGVVGSQIDLPLVFASEFTRELFTQLLDKNRSEKLGELLQQLTRFFLDECSNPLAMTYGLYHGADLRVIY
jgi:hypothetical protein